MTYLVLQSLYFSTFRKPLSILCPCKSAVAVSDTCPPNVWAVTSTNEQLWSRAEMLLPSAMFCNNSQCEVDNCIKSSINRGGDEIYSTEEQEIQESFPRIDPLKFLKLIDEGAVAVL